jgi:hypothetical protein
MKINVNQLRVYESSNTRLRPSRPPQAQPSAPSSQPHLSDMFMTALYDPAGPAPRQISRPGFLLDRYI